MNIIVDNYIRIKRSEIPDKWLAPLMNLVSVPNEEKETAIKEHVWGAKSMPDRIYLGGEVGDEIVLPRGFYRELLSKLDGAGIQTTVIDQTSNAYTSSFIPKNNAAQTELRPDQQEPYEALLLSGYGGILNLSTGSGKTVIALKWAATQNQRTLILVNKASLAKQWQDRAMEHFGIEMGFIGDGKWDEKDFTVSTFQTLNSRSETLDEYKWWEKWGIVIHDESHHSVADTYFDILNKFPATWRVGLSATLGKSPAKKKIAELTFGPVIYQDLEIEDKPILKRIDTDFEFDFNPTFKGETGKVVRNNYSSLLKELVRDVKRNELVARNIESDPQASHIVFSKRLKHLDYIADMVRSSGADIECLMYTGDKTLEERQNIEQRASQGHCVIFTTLADEGMDIPRLDRIHLPFPTKDPETIKQQVGRGLRKHPDKTECIVYDYVDYKCGVLENQWRKRLNGYYRKQKIEIKK